MGVREELLKQQEELLGSQRLQFPLEKVQVDQSEKAFRIGGRKEDGEWVDAKYSQEIEFVFLKRYGEYIYFDPEKEAVTKRSTIEENASNCKEIVSGVPISELKEAGYNMKYIAHLVGLLKTDKGMVCADLQLKGAGLKSFIDFLSSNKEYNRNRLLYKLKVTLEERKKGAVKYVTPFFLYEEVDESEGKEILSKAKDCISKFEEFRKAYNERNNNKGTSSEEIAEPVEYEDEDEGLPF